MIIDHNPGKMSFVIVLLGGWAQNDMLVVAGGALSYRELTIAFPSPWELVHLGPETGVAFGIGERGASSSLGLRAV